MKRIYATAIVLITLGIAWTLYLRYQNKRFIDNLPKGPTPVTKRMPTPNTSTIDEHENNETPETADPATHSNESIIEESPLTTDTPQGTAPQKSEVIVPKNVPEDISEPNTFTETPEPEKEQPGIRELSLEEIMEKNREHLIKKHGDIPEVDIFLKHFPFESLQQGKTKIERTRTLSSEEILNYKKSIATLWPNKSNLKNYQDALKMQERK